MTIEIIQRIFEKLPNAKFYGDASNGSRVDPCGLTDMAKFVAAFRSFWKAPKNTL